MADNTKNDGRKTTTRRTTAKRDDNGATARKAAPRKDTTRKPAPRRRDDDRSRYLSEANTKRIALGAAAVGVAGIAGALFAAWRKHADEMDAHDYGDELIEDGDIDTLSGGTGMAARGRGTADNTGGTATGGGQASKVGSGKRGQVKEARDVIGDDDREGFAPATVPLTADERL